MQLKYVVLPLLAVAAVLLFAWNQKPPRVGDVVQAVPIAPPENSLASMAPVQDSLEQRLTSLSERVYGLENRDAGVNDLMPAIEDLQRRLEALEVQLRKQPAYGEEARDGNDSNHGLYDLGSPDSRISEVQLAFENDTRLGKARQLELENVAAIFDTEELNELDFTQIDCTDHYCRLIYDDYSTDGAAASIVADNELVLLLSQKYGGNVTIHAGERKGTSRTIYIELGTH